MLLLNQKALLVDRGQDEDSYGLTLALSGSTLARTAQPAWKWSLSMYQRLYRAVQDALLKPEGLYEVLLKVLQVIPHSGQDGGNSIMLQNNQAYTVSGCRMGEESL